MHPFDHPPNTDIITGSWSDWKNSIDQHYLDVCGDKSVLEIASGIGDISQRVIEHKPRSLTLVEPDVPNSPIPDNKLVNWVKSDIFQWLNKPRPFDVVMSFGLMYHLHNPLHLLELIVNYCKPEHIIFDNVVAPHPLQFNLEVVNTTGNRQVDQDWLVCPFNMPAPFFIFNQSLDHMGYTLIKSHHVRCDPFQKSNSWVASWTRKLVNQN